MRSIVTYNIKLKTQCQEHYNKILDTLIIHKKIFNRISEYVYETKNVNKKLIHDNSC